MDAFESIVSTILECEGWWVRRSLRVAMSKRDKRAAGRPTMPAYELDLVAYRGRTNELWVIECKSFLDSAGVYADGFEDRRSQSAPRYKLFNDRRLWTAVRRALVRSLVASKCCRARPRVRLCLAAGRIATGGDRRRLRSLFNRHRWLLMDDHWMAERLRKLAQQRYSNNESIIAVKILERASAREAAGRR